MALYNVGNTVIHKIFGKGKIIKVEERPMNINGVPCKPDPAIITVEFEKEMLTEKEKELIHYNPRKIRQFSEASLPEFALIDEN